MWVVALAFLNCVSAEFYENVHITGIDTFEHSSLKRSSLEGAKENARTLDFPDRIIFKKDNVFRFTPAEKFDIAVSKSSRSLLAIDKLRIVGNKQFLMTCPF